MDSGNWLARRPVSENLAGVAQGQSTSSVRRVSPVQIWPPAFSFRIGWGHSLMAKPRVCNAELWVQIPVAPLFPRK